MLKLRRQMKKSIQMIILEYTIISIECKAILNKENNSLPLVVVVVTMVVPENKYRPVADPYSLKMIVNIMIYLSISKSVTYISYRPTCDFVQ